MSQKTTTPQTAKNSKLSEQRSDTLNLPSPSGETGLKVVPRSPGTETNNMKQLLNEFKGLHEQRLRWLELDLTMTQEELLQKKEDFLRSYVNDLTDQNQVLVQTIEDLQMEADHKLLHTSDHILDDPDQQGATQELIRHLRHLRSDMDSIAQLIQRPGHRHGLDLLVQITAELENLKIQLQTKDMVISDLERELRGEGAKAKG